MNQSLISIPFETVSSRILLIRGQKVMLDFTLADMYGVETKVLNQAVGRNKQRFPDDFMFRLNQEEFDHILRSQFVTSSSNWGGTRYLPRAFTQEGIAMLSSALRSERAIEVNIAIMRAFVQMREAMLSHEDMAKRIDEMEAKYDGQFATVFDALRQLFETPVPPKHPIGYIQPKK